MDEVARIVVIGKPEQRGSKTPFVLRSRGKMLKRGGGIVRTASDTPILLLPDANKRSDKHMKKIANAARQVWQDRPPITEPVSLSVEFYFDRPKCHYRTGKFSDQLKPNSPAIYHAKKPDLDKLLRTVSDAITMAGLWKDDCQMASITAASKRWTAGKHEEARTIISIQRLSDS